MLYLDGKLPGWEGQSPPTYKHQKGKNVVPLYDEQGRVRNMRTQWASKISLVFQKLPHFGEFEIQRQRRLAELYKDCNIKDEWTLHHNGASSECGIPDSTNGCIKNRDAPIPKMKDIIGRALPRIGAYKQLDNTKQVVALIDDVILFRNFYYFFF